MTVTSAEVRTVTAGVHRHWFLGPTGSNVNQCSIALWSSTAYRNGYELVDSVLAVVLHRHRPLGHVRRWRHTLVYRPLVDLSTMEERHVIITYRLDGATIQELCTQL
ncbi:hypothetical protein NDU88_006261 [Pleurodeles waltl]|uniref:Uncharacterized protein n=1 Tax=Pleurodeles waltl TaxID=8319 RepID=A0AAV7PHY2_PLEWA|nr:hypothetical protein NDU88_006261 [Pleurodeles waltl]